MAGFDADRPQLRTTATARAGDVASIATTGTDASGGAGEERAACHGGPLATALRTSAAKTTACTTSASTDAAGAGTTLAGNADRHADDDTFGQHRSG